MKKNEKAKKVTVKKSAPVSKKAPAKKAAPKAATKSTAKKTTPKKAVTAKVSAAKVAPANKKAAKPAAPAKKAAAQKMAPAKAVKKAVATARKNAPVTKATPKAVNKPADKKTAAPKIVKKSETVKDVAPKAVKSDKPVSSRKQNNMTPAKTSATGSASPILVKMPQNQNMPAVSNGSVKPALVMAPQKVPSTAGATAMVRPAYRPIQVINKPLAPLQPTRQMAPIEKNAEKIEFKKGDYVCYPAHGVGEIEAVETQIISGMEIKLYTIAFEKDRMRLKVPVAKAHASGLRRLSSVGRMEDALKTLQGRAHVRRAMWSRRAQEYETKINSGDPVSIAEVLRDLKRSNDETEQSYSERQIYQSALERLAREVAAVEKISEEAAAERLENMIKGRKARASAERKEQAA